MSEHARQRILQSAHQAQEVALRMAWELEYQRRQGSDESVIGDLETRTEKAKAQALIAANKSKLKPKDLRELKVAVLTDIREKHDGERQWERSQLAVKRAAKLKDHEEPAIPDQTPDGRMVPITIAAHIDNIAAYENALELTDEWLAKYEPSTNGDAPKRKSKKKG